MAREDHPQDRGPNSTPGDDLAEFSTKVFRIVFYLIGFMFLLGLGYAAFLWVLHAVTG